MGRSHALSSVHGGLVSKGIHHRMDRYANKLLKKVLSSKINFDIVSLHIYTEVILDNFSSAPTDLAMPAITVCKSSKYDVGEYLRAVFDNFEYACEWNEKTMRENNCTGSGLLRKHFKALTTDRFDLDGNNDNVGRTLGNVDSTITLLLSHLTSMCEAI